MIDAPPPGQTRPSSDWQPDEPGPEDVPCLHALLVSHELTARGGSGAALADVEVDVTGAGASTHRHRVLRDGGGVIRGWATVQDRAAGRVVVSVVVQSDAGSAAADDAGAALYAWAADEACDLARRRGLDLTQLDAGAFAGDERQRRWLGAAGYEHVRTWWQMSRPVTADEGLPGAFPPPKPGVVVRLVEQSPPGARPSDDDLRAIHDVLEESFADHFNYHEESFDEFVARQREDVGHRWDHWWVAELVDGEGDAVPAGALVGTVSGDPDGMQPCGSYVAYLGVLRSARGRGVAKSLLHAVIADAASRGRDRVGLEVDADSPTGADGMYTWMGFDTAYVTQSWHRDLPVA